MESGESVRTNASYEEWKEFYSDVVGYVLDDDNKIISYDFVRILFADGEVTFENISADPA